MRRTSHNFCLGSWNVRTLLQDGSKELVVEELMRFGVNVGCLQEVRMAGSGSVVVKNRRGNKWTLAYSGRCDTAPVHGVGVLMDGEMERAWRNGGSELHAISPRVMAVVLRFSRLVEGEVDSLRVFIVSAYAPTSAASDEDVEEFYCDLEHALGLAGRQDMVIVAGDFNARVSGGRADASDTEGEIRGPFGMERTNAAGVRLLSFCGMSSLSITQSWFKTRSWGSRATWRNPGTGRWHCLDYVLVPQSQRGWCVQSRSEREADCGSDHSLVRSTFCVPGASFRKRKFKKQRGSSRFPVRSLSHPEQQQKFQTSVAEGLRHTVAGQPLSEDGVSSGESQERLQSLIDVLTEAGTSLDREERRRTGWFEEAEEWLGPLIAEKRRAWKMVVACDSETEWEKYRNLRSQVRGAVRKAKNDFYLRKAKEADFDSKRHPWKEVRSLMDEFRPRRPPPVDVVCERDGSHCGNVNRRWREHFTEVLNVPSSVHESTEDVLQDVVENDDLDLEAEPTIEEVEEALSHMRRGTAAGQDGIPPEALKCGGQAVVEALHRIFVTVWREGRVPEEWRDAEMVPLPKKGDLSSCDNWRGISLLSVCGKAFARILSRRLRLVAQRVLPESQCGFRPGRGTNDMVFTASQLAERAKEFGITLFLVFVDLRKAYDSVPREALWRVLLQFGVPVKLVSLIKGLHEGMEVRVRVGEEHTDSIGVNNGLRQGCVLAPLLFLFYSHAVLTDWYDRCSADPGIGRDEVEAMFGGNGGPACGMEFWYKTGGRIPGGQPTAKEKAVSQRTRIRECEFADDIALIAMTQSIAERITHHYIDASSAWGLSVSIKKTKIMAIGQQASSFRAGNGSSSGEIQAVKSFRYLGVQLNQDGRWCHTIDDRIVRASRMFQSLRVPLFHNRHVNINVKRYVLDGAVCGCLMYGSECWAPTREDERRLDRFYMACVRNILGISRCSQWRCRISNTDLLDEMRGEGKSCVLPSVRVQMGRLRWAGHVARMPMWRPPLQAMFSWLKERRPKPPTKRWKDCLRRDLVTIGLDPRSSDWFWVAQDRELWRGLCTGRAEVKTTGQTPRPPTLPSFYVLNKTMGPHIVAEFDSYNNRYMVGRVRYRTHFDEDGNEPEDCVHIEYNHWSCDREVQDSSVLAMRCRPGENASWMARVHLLTMEEIRRVLGDVFQTKHSGLNKGDLVYRLGERLRRHVDPSGVFTAGMIRKMCDT